MLTMFEPDIRWHYYGKLQTILEDTVCGPILNRIIESLQNASSSQPTVLLIPLSYRESCEFETVLNRFFKQRNMKVYVTDLYGRFLTKPSTLLERQNDAYELTIDTRSIATLIHQFVLPSRQQEQLKPKNKLGSFFSSFLRKKSNPANLYVESRSASIEINTQLSIVMLASSITDDTVVQPSSEEINQLKEIFSKQNLEIEVLERPYIERAILYKMINSIPSTILDQSHKWEKKFNKLLEGSEEELPEAFLLKPLWKELASKGNSFLLASEIYNVRKKLIEKSLLHIYPWEALFSFLDHLVYFIDGDREFIGRWYSKVEANVEGKAYFEDIDDLGGYENSVYCLHFENDPKCLLYTVMYHGYTWLSMRMAMGQMLNGLRSETSFAASYWELY